jgi:hypothetical protein
MSEHPIVIYSALNAVEAHQLKNLLVEMGIEAFVANENLQGLIGFEASSWSTAARVLVAAENAAAARRIAAEFDRRGRGTTGAAASSQPVEPDRFNEHLSSSTVSDSPSKTEYSDRTRACIVDLCPQCSRRRTAVCPICKTAGSNFDPGQSNVDEHDHSGEPPLLICPTCDEPFEPSYLRSCEWCGHDFESGISIPRPAVPSDFESPNSRVIIVAVGLLALIGGLMAYFAKVLE